MKQMVYAQSGIRTEKWNALTFLGFWDTHRSSAQGQMTRPGDSQQKKKEPAKLRTWPFRLTIGKTERKRKERWIPRPCQRTEKKLWDIKVMRILIVIGALGTVTKGLIRSLGGLGNKRTSEDYLNYSIIEIDHNAKETFGGLKRLAITQTPVENQQLTLVWKLSNELDNINKREYTLKI